MSMTKRWIATLFAVSMLVAGILPFIGCGYQETTRASSPAPTTAEAGVEISDFAFKLQTLQVYTGTEVFWTNNDSVTHTMTSRYSLFDNGNHPEAPN